MKLMMSNIFRAWRRTGCAGLLCATGLLFSAIVLAERCDPAPGNEYEKILCDLKRSGKGAGLPDLYQFRQNPPTVQALMLKKVAEREGIAIKLPERGNEETLRRQDDLLMAHGEKGKDALPLGSAVKTIAIIQQAPVAAVAPKAPAATSVSTPAVAAAPKAPALQPATASVPVNEASLPTTAAPAVTTALQDCALEKLSFQCADGRYQLVGNKTNQQLPDDALSDGHKLGLPVYKGSPDDTVALDHYLARAYDQYLTGMVDIGLGAATMSYSKFVHLYHYITGQHLDFNVRFETMYEYLKQDKASMGVNIQVALAEGLTTQYCSQLDHFIACDYGHTNYVFARQVMATP
jgi:hypothetical protein